MFTEQPTMNSLFSQLGLGSSDEEIAEFFETHRGLNKANIFMKRLIGMKVSLHF